MKMKVKPREQKRRRSSQRPTKSKSLSPDIKSSSEINNTAIETKDEAVKKKEDMIV